MVWESERRHFRAHVDEWTTFGYQRYARELTVALTTAREAADILLYWRRKTDLSLQTKSDGTPVTMADQHSNLHIVKCLEEAFPDDGIVSEEMETKHGERMWYVDPLDGTRSFISGNDEFAIHIGLAVDQKPVMGVVYRPYPFEIFYSDGKHAYHVDIQPDEFDMSYWRTPLSTHIPHDERRIAVLGHDYDERFLEILLPQEVKSMASEGLRLTMLARGEADVHMVDSSRRAGSWDFCAPQAILEAAGGSMCFSDCSPITYHGQRRMGKDIMAARTRTLLTDILSRVP